MFIALVNKTKGWAVILDDAGDVRESSSADDLLAELSASYPLTKIIIADRLVINEHTLSLTGGSISESYQVDQDLSELLPYLGA